MSAMSNGHVDAMTLTTPMPTYKLQQQTADLNGGRHDHRMSVYGVEGKEAPDQSGYAARFYKQAPALGRSRHP